ncbi:YfiT family bacillithiol transferase [Polaribacter sp. Hel1_85]|uniref:YfiT family bacillithiol transferase n=1 Tax=Polaribacter sp. Hel1_85 TaxID=1250005 RepID=UPI00052C0663|nr:putative metal-dependent hydrolase [Polaribacter sp. Hel1_85]KGL63144.1 metal-dependent hydrolase [Polaribacter sp. Hel1_85]
MTIEELKYPIGKFNIPEKITKKNIEDWISLLERFPQELEFLTRELSENQLDTPYRENGWTIRQVVHHCYDSHHNSYTRFKWALTEDKPVIKAYFEERWAELHDSKSAPILLSIDGLKALHSKWVYLLRGLSEKDLEKSFIHPSGNEEVSLKENIGIYAWHCRHHYHHIEQLMIRKGWK